MGSWPPAGCKWQEIEKEEKILVSDNTDSHEKRKAPATGRGFTSIQMVHTHTLDKNRIVKAIRWELNPQTNKLI